MRCLKKIIFISVLISLVAFMTFVCFAKSDVTAKSAIVMDADTKRVLYGKNINDTLSMASTTKIMTALICLEQKDIQKEYKVDKNAIMVEGTSMGLKEGDKVSLKTLVVGMLLLSGNDAANAAAVIVAGSQEKFVKIMNKRAQEIGMKDTVFVTPSGLDKDNHHSTAYDMALVSAEALKNKEFADICSSSKYCVTYNGREHTFYNHNRLLKELDGCIGIKTGFTKKSGRCLVSAVKRNGRTLICVTLKAPDDWNDHKRLYEQCFSEYNKVSVCDIVKEKYSINIVNSPVSSVSLSCDDTGEIFVLKNEKITVKPILRGFEYAPVYKGLTAGSVCVFADGVKIYSAPLYYECSAPLTENEKKS